MKHYIIEGVVFNEGILQSIGDWWNSDDVKNVRHKVKRAVISAKDAFINNFLPFAIDWLDNNKDALLAASANVDWTDRTKRKQQMALIGAGLGSLYMDYKKFNARDRAELDRWVQINTMANDMRDLYNRTRRANQTQIPHLQTRNLGEAGEMFMREYNFFFSE